MDWMNFWARKQIIGEYWNERARRKEEKKLAEALHDCRTEINSAMADLSGLLSDLSLKHVLALDLEQTNTIEELLPYFPMAEVLSHQGYIGAEQRAYLETCLNIDQPRYNIAQFLKAAIDREGIYPEWNNLLGLSQTHCGTVWRTLIEMICRQRAPELGQQIFDAISTIFYGFYMLENFSIEGARPIYSSFLSNFNYFAEINQNEPYLHAVMLLQKELANQLGGNPQDYIPCLDTEESYDMDGMPGFDFSVHKQGDNSFIGFFVVKKTTSRDEKDLIWECPAGGKPPIIFFSE